MFLRHGKRYTISETVQSSVSSEKSAGIATQGTTPAFTPQPQGVTVLRLVLITGLMTASLQLLPAVDDFDHPASLRARFQELAQVSAIDHSLLQDCRSGAVCLSMYISDFKLLGSSADC